MILVFGKSVCPGCVVSYSRLRALQQRLTGEPFAIVGVNAGEEKDLAGIRDALAEHRVSWPVV